MTAESKTGRVVDEPALRDREHIFGDRQEAGSRLAGMLSAYRDSGALVLAIPAGGVPVGARIARDLHLEMDLIIVRKVQIPWNPEAGFGAMGPDGASVFDDRLLAYLNLSEAQVQEQVEKTRRLLAHREARFRGGRPYPEMQGRTVIAVDDGLASGSTMLAALDFIARRRPAKMVVAVPTALRQTIERLRPRVDELFCLNVRSRTPFAVAAAYRNWYDLNDQEVLDILTKAQDATQ